MIPNQWYAVLESNEVRPGGVVGVIRMGEKMIFWRDAEGKIACLKDSCPHRGVALSKGAIRQGHVECPFHGLRFDSLGECVLIPANGRGGPISREMRVGHYPTHEAHGFIFIWWGQDAIERPLPRFFTDLEDGFTYGTAQDPWKTHYSRVIENQLDVAHLPFIHYNTIGRGGRTVVDGPVVEWIDDDMFFVYVFNRADDGTPPRRASELETSQRKFRLEFLFPNLWQNHISDKVRVVAAFVPVDDDHTILYLRFYQRFLQTPLLREVVNRLAMPFNIYVAHQDRTVVETEEPKRTTPKIGEKLFQADRPIVAYRVRRQALTDQASKGISQITGE